MKKNNYGRVVNIASIFGVISREKRSIYSSSKSGLIGLTRAMALDLAPHNILVNSVSPGFVLTDLTKKMLGGPEIRELKSKIPIKRLAMPADISKVVLFLSSDLNTYLVGQNIIVDGGYANI
jgi:3-oxoacyl-[acyl-carrier protein] reductase